MARWGCQYIYKAYKRDFNFVFKHLSTNYRCGSNIVDFAKSSILLNKNRFEKEIKADSDHKGSVSILNLPTMSDMDLADKTLKYLDNNGGIGEDAGLLVRETKHAIPIAVLLQ